MDVRSVPQDAAVQLVQRAVDKVTLLVEKNAEQLFKNSEFYSLVRKWFIFGYIYLFRFFSCLFVCLQLF